MKCLTRTVSEMSVFIKQPTQLKLTIDCSKDKTLICS